MGSPLYNYLSCDRRLIGLGHCDNRDCPTCGFQRRKEWPEEMIGWSLDCQYFRLKGSVRRNKLIWPTDDLLPTSHEVLGMDSFEQLVEFVDPALPFWLFKNQDCEKSSRLAAA